MTTEKLKQLIASRGFTEEQFAAILFPTKKHPSSALRYLLQGRRELKQSELEKIAQILGTPNESKDEGSSWKSAEFSGRIAFQKGDYVGVYNADMNSATLMKGAEIVAEQLFVSKTTAVPEFISILNSLIASHEAQNSN